MPPPLLDVGLVDPGALPCRRIQASHGGYPVEGGQIEAMGIGSPRQPWVRIDRLGDGSPACSVNVRDREPPRQEPQRMLFLLL
ncbi:hypothetical protein ZWY2020_021595 [Hordeum vulgare]|nr:hypothetical protein ZWY2020_021595 [Hordeum vulgare]